MSSEMIERVAKAIKVALQAHGDSEYVGEKPRYANRTQLEGDFDLTAVARAAIAAMREPTKAMLSIGQDEIEFHVPDAGNPCRPHPHASAEAWNVMIDEALKP